MMRSARVAFACALLAAPAHAAPMGPGTEPVTVLALEADRAGDLAAKTITNALRQAVLDAPEFTIGGVSPALVATAYDAKCQLKGWNGLSPDDRAFDEPCLRKIGKHLGVARFFWGVVAGRDGRLTVRLHFWQPGQPDRAAELPYDDARRDRVVERLYRKLVTPDKVGDVTVSGRAEGELFVDGRSAGPYAAGDELTLPVGEHELEVRQVSRVASRGRASVTPAGRTEARLDAVVTPATPTARPPDHDPPPIVVRPKASAWPWILGGTAAVGFVGAGAFWALRGAALDDLSAVCQGRACPADRQDAIGRADRHGAFAALSLGVGLSAGAGLATYLLLSGRPPRVVGAMIPVAGGAAAALGGTF
ncbi:MAG TPA: hypothetical protein VFS00_18775 [Polyangiaceae bacterium]|nr:hypothetical protein [Polyangiaceae bacterium]